MISYSARAPLTRVWNQVAPYILNVVGGLPFGTRRIPAVQAEDGLSVSNLSWGLGIPHLAFDLGYEGDRPVETGLCEVFDSTGAVIFSQSLQAITVGSTMHVEVPISEDIGPRMARLRVCSFEHRTQPPPPPPPEQPVAPGSKPKTAPSGTGKDSKA